MSDHRYVRDLLGPYLLGSLEPEDEMEVRRHLGHCEACQSEEQSLRQPHERLRELANVAETPPPGLKSRVLSGTSDQPPHRRSSRLPLLAAAAAVLLALAVSVTLYASGFFAPEPVAEATLRPTEPASQAGGELRVRRSEPNVQAQLEVWNLPQPGPNQYYELWFGKGEGRVSAGTFTVDAEGRGTLRMTVPETPGDYQRVGITLEEFPREPRMDSAKVVLGGELQES